MTDEVAIHLKCAHLQIAAEEFLVEQLRPTGTLKRQGEDSACRTQLHPRACIALMLLATVATLTQADEKKPPPEWRMLVTTKGQSMPVPEAWLSDEEAQIAHSLIPPSVVPPPVPFDFEQPWHERLWFGAHRKQAIRYFNHLCSTEAGQWIVRTVPNVEGLYVSRPHGSASRESSNLMTKLYGPESPWTERVFAIRSDDLETNGKWFVNPPFYNYRFVEQPRRPHITWQEHIANPYVRLFGYTQERTRDQQGRLTDHFRNKSPMQIAGVSEPASHFGYTWRGIRRPQDREHGIAGGELLIYDLKTHDVLAIRRQFVITQRNRKDGDSASWEVATPCSQVKSPLGGAEFTQFVIDVLKTTDLSSTGSKP